MEKSIIQVQNKIKFDCQVTRSILTILVLYFLLFTIANPKPRKKVGIRNGIQPLKLFMLMILFGEIGAMPQPNYFIFTINFRIKTSLAKKKWKLHHQWHIIFAQLFVRGRSHEFIPQNSLQSSQQIKNFTNQVNKN